MGDLFHHEVSETRRILVVEFTPASWLPWFPGASLLAAPSWPGVKTRHRRAFPGRLHRFACWYTPRSRGSLEVRDPLTGANIQPVLGPNGFTYNLQELAFFSWPYGAPSIAVNGCFRITTAWPRTQDPCASDPVKHRPRWSPENDDLHWSDPV